MFSIQLQGMSFRSPIGCIEAERRVGNRFEVDVELAVRYEEAAQADDLDGTVNYARVYEVVRDEMAKPCRIVENAAHRIMEAIYAEWGRERIGKIIVRVSKIAPPVGGKVQKATVELTSPQC